MSAAVSSYQNQIIAIDVESQTASLNPIERCKQICCENRRLMRDICTIDFAAIMSGSFIYGGVALTMNASTQRIGYIPIALCWVPLFCAIAIITRAHVNDRRILYEAIENSLNRNSSFLSEASFLSDD